MSGGGAAPRRELSPSRPQASPQSLPPHAHGPARTHSYSLCGELPQPETHPDTVLDGLPAIRPGASAHSSPPPDGAQLRCGGSESLLTAGADSSPAMLVPEMVPGLVSVPARDRELTVGPAGLSRLLAVTALITSTRQVERLQLPPF